MDPFPRVGRRSIHTGRAIALAVVALFAGIPAAKASTAAAAAEGHAHTIRVASLGDGAGAESLRARVIERLKTSGGFKVIEGSSAADFVLRGTSSVWPTGNITLNPRTNGARETVYEGYLSVELLNNADQTLWSYLVTPSRFRTASITDDLATTLSPGWLKRLQAGQLARRRRLQPGRERAPRCMRRAARWPLRFTSSGLSRADSR